MMYTGRDRLRSSDGGVGRCVVLRRLIAAHLFHGCGGDPLPEFPRRRRSGMHQQLGWVGEVSRACPQNSTQSASCSSYTGTVRLLEMTRDTRIMVYKGHLIRATLEAACFWVKN